MGRIWTLVWGLILVGIGLVFLADTLSNGEIDAGAIIGRWWPLILLLLGAAILIPALWPGRPVVRTLALDLQGAPRAVVRVDFGAGRLRIGRAAAGRLLEGSFEAAMLKLHTKPKAESL